MPSYDCTYGNINNRKRTQEIIEELTYATNSLNQSPALSIQLSIFHSSTTFYSRL